MEKDPLLETAPEPVSAPEEKSAAVIPVPLKEQQRVVPDAKSVVAIDVVSDDPSLIDAADGVRVQVGGVVDVSAIDIDAVEPT